MQLFHSPTSPFVRKVRMLAHERGLADAIELRPVVFLAPNPELAAANPLAKVPALVLDDGTVIYDSPVICEYLDSLPGGRHLFPAPGPARWAALTLQALADGLADAAVLRRMEEMRPEGERSKAFADKQTNVLRRGLAALETQAEGLPAEPHIGTLAVIAALGYLDLRAGDLAWRDAAPRLAAWLAVMAERPSVRDTAPPAA
jgi:glutathione S-transferase